MMVERTHNNRISGASTTETEDASSSSISGAAVDPNENDVLSGRGDNINRHPGNQKFRKLVLNKKKIYSTSQYKREKRLIAASIVSEIRDLDPPGRFLCKDPDTGLWHEIDDEKAHEKTKQALREKLKPVQTERKEPEATSRKRSAVHAPAEKVPPPAHRTGWIPPSYYNYVQPPLHHRSPMPLRPMEQRGPMPHYSFPPPYQYSYPGALPPGRPIVAVSPTLLPQHAVRYGGVQNSVPRPGAYGPHGGYAAKS